jgi:hypothetical protein
VTAEGFAWPTTSRTVATAFATLALVTALSHGLPGDYANVAVAAAFLGVTWLVVLRQDPLTVRAYGVSLAGLFEPDEMDWRQLVREAARSLGWVLLFALIFFPPFAFGFDRVWAAHKSFALRVPSDWLDRASGQLLVVALPEELFFRGLAGSPPRPFLRSVTSSPSPSPAGSRCSFPPSPSAGCGRAPEASEPRSCSTPPAICCRASWRWASVCEQVDWKVALMERSVNNA